LDSDCPNTSTLPHKAVDPEELSAAGLAGGPPVLVTLQVGADDVNFAGCLRHLLGEIVFENCFVQDAQGNPQLSPEVQADLTGLNAGLEGYRPASRISGTVCLAGSPELLPNHSATVRPSFGTDPHFATTWLPSGW
jgi:hypothetical protein